MTGRGHPAVTSALLAACLVLPPVLAAAFGSVAGHAWSALLTDLLEPYFDGFWRVLRGGLKWIMPPALLVVVVVSLVVVARRSLLRVAVALVGTAGPFLLAQLVKRELLPFPSYAPEGGAPLSGHAATAASALFAVLVAVPDRVRGRVAVAGAVLVLGVELGVVVSSWHDAGDVVLSLVVAACWWGVLGVVLTVLRPHAPPHSAAPARSRGVAAWPFALTAVAGAGAAAVVVGTGPSPVGALAGAVLTAVAGAALLAGAGLASVGALDRHDAGRRLPREPRPGRGPGQGRTTAGDQASGTAMAGAPVPSAGSDHTSVTPDSSVRGTP